MKQETEREDVPAVGRPLPQSNRHKSNIARLPTKALLNILWQLPNGSPYYLRNGIILIGQYSLGAAVSAQDLTIQHHLTKAYLSHTPLGICRFTSARVSISLVYSSTVVFSVKSIDYLGRFQCPTTSVGGRSMFFLVKTFE